MIEEGNITWKEVNLIYSRKDFRLQGIFRNGVKR